MSTLILLVGSLILTALAFILPVFTIFLSLFSDGTDSLSDKYNAEKKQSDENLRNEIDKQQPSANVDYALLQKTIRALKRKIRKAKRRLRYLKPSYVAIRIAVPFTISFACVLAAALLDARGLYIPLFICLFVSLLAFLWGTYTLWNAFSVITEAADIVSRNRKDSYSKITELLTKLVEQSDTEADKLFIPSKLFSAKFNKEKVIAEKVFQFSVNKKYEIPISIVNSDKKMAKLSEVGFIFPEVFLLEGKKGFSITADGKTQIVRYNIDIIQAQENRICAPLTITFLQAGEYDITIFLKGENVSYQKFNFKIDVIN